MKMIAIGLAGLLSAGALLAAPTTAHAAGMPEAPTVGQLKLMHAVSNFRITDHFFQRDQALAVDMAHNPCGHGNPMAFFQLMGEIGKGRLTLSQAAQQLAAQPGMESLLAKHGLSAHDALVGGLAMMFAKMNAMPMLAGGTTSGSVDTPIARANIAFLKAHMAEVQASHAKIRAIARQRLDANGGKLPACERSILGAAHSTRSPR